MFIDLTLSIRNDDPVVEKARVDPKRWWITQGHIGTHLDVCPGLSPPPIDYCLRRGVLIDVEGIGTQEIGVEVLNGHDIQPGDFVIFYTGHVAATRYASPEYFSQQPRMHWHLVKALSASEVSLVGLDFPGMRPTEEHGDADMMLGESGKYVIENLNNVDVLHQAARDGTPFQVVSGWTGFAGSSGLSCRVAAKVGE